MGSRGPAGPPGKNGDDVSGLLIDAHSSSGDISQDIHVKQRKDTALFGPSNTWKTLDFLLLHVINL